MILAISLIVVPYLPAANILFPVGFVIAERILYLPSAGYCLLIAININKLCCNTNRKVYKVCICLQILLLFDVLYNILKKNCYLLYGWSV